MKNKELYQIEGFLGADCLVKQKSESNITYSILKVAKNRSKFDKDKNTWIQLEPYWFEVVAFDGLADQCASLKKGDGVMLKADIIPYTYEINTFNQNGEAEAKTISSTKYIAKKIVKFQYLQKVTEDNFSQPGPTVDDITDLNF